MQSLPACEIDRPKSVTRMKLKTRFAWGDILRSEHEPWWRTGRTINTHHADDLAMSFPPSPQKSVTDESSSHPYTNPSSGWLEGSHTYTPTHTHTHTHTHLAKFNSICLRSHARGKGSAAQTAFISRHKLIHKKITSTITVAWSRAYASSVNR